jgi:hypothetical protein
MFMISLPADVKVGDTVACKINGDPALVRWRDQETLVIQPGDARAILHTELDRNMRDFCCGDDASKGFRVRVERLPDGSVIVSK